MRRIRHYPGKLVIDCLRLFSLISLGVFLSACGKGEFSSLEALPVDEYLKKPGNFLGNTYLISAQIDSQIKWEEGVGRILAVEAEGSSSRLPVFVPEGAGRNLYVGQRYEMRANIREGGLIYVEDLRKF
ncbi:MAG TPA: hypothetical protein VJ952_09080 [Opitutales bacterium]|nr:hypothetical protein [Opitutales bacterium]